MKKIINLSILTALAILFAFLGCKKNNPVPAPVISSISPVSGLAGISITISGSNFDPSASKNTVKFNGTAATVTSATSSALIVTAPAGGSTGSITVTTAGGTATGPVFTYLLAPIITSISPTTAVAGSAITITGTNFDVTAVNNIVKFNGTAATVASATATSLVVTAPPTGSSGAVTVTTSGGTATGPVFTYIAVPAITAISPASAAAGAVVTITGTNFDATAANDIVKFNGTAASVTSASLTQLVVTVPAAGSSGNVTVTTTGGTSNAIAFTYLPANGQNIYVLGSDIQQGLGWWKNSTFTAIAACTSAYSMAVAGPDVYVAGPSTTNTPTYWKNNTAVQLSAQTGNLFSVFVSGPDVYCLGQINGAYFYWKNSSATSLTTSSVSTIGGSVAGPYLNNVMAVDNSGNIYVAGAQYLGNSTILKATYWKNGTPIDLTDGITSGSAYATAVYVSGPDVYVAGIEEITANGGVINRAPRLWKNGVSIPITTPANSILNSITSILVSGSNVYLGGQYNNAGAVWKNGALLSPATYSVAENVSSIFLYNNTDLYITGASSSSGNNCYWKNGNFVEMDPGCQVVSPNCTRTAANQVISIYVN